VVLLVHLVVVVVLLGLLVVVVVLMSFHLLRSACLLCASSLSSQGIGLASVTSVSSLLILTFFFELKNVNKVLE